VPATRPQVKREHPFAQQIFRDFFVQNFLCQPFYDGSFADTCFADRHRVVFGAPRQHLEDAQHLALPPDHRVKLAFLG
jgi:hypothetical protein